MPDNGIARLQAPGSVLAGGAVAALLALAGAAATAAEAPHVVIAPVARFGGSISAVAVGEDRVWYAQGRRLTALDVEDHSAPRWLWEIEVPHEVTGLAAAGTALAAGGPKGIVLLEGAASGQPRTVAEITGAATGSKLAATGGYLYVARSGEVAVVDIRQPDRPRLVRTDLLAHAGDLPGGAAVVDIVAAGDRLAVALAVPGREPLQLWLLEVRSPREPRLAWRHASPHWRWLAARAMPDGVVVYGLGRAGIVGIDAADADQPRLLADRTIEWLRGRGNFLRGLALDLDGSPIVVTGEWHSGFHNQGALIRLNGDGENVGLAGFSSQPFPGPAASGSAGVAVGGVEGVFHLAGGYAGLAMPALIDAVDVAVDDRGTGPRLYATSENGGLLGFDIGAPQDPAKIGRSPRAFGSYRGGLTVDDGVAVMMNLGALDLPASSADIVDVTNEPWFASEGSLPGYIEGRMAQVGRTLWVVRGNATLERYDVSPGHARDAVVAHALGGTVRSVAARDDLIAATGYEAQGPSWPPTVPVRLTLVRPAGDDVAVVFDGPIDVQMAYDPNDRQLPVVRLMDRQAAIISAWVEGDDRLGTLSLVDVSDPTSPRVEDSLRLGSRPQGLYASAGLAFVRGARGIDVYDVRGGRLALQGTLAPPATGWSAYSPPNAHSMARHYATMYVAAGGLGVLVYDLPASWLADEATPTVTLSPTPSATPSPTRPPSVTPAATRPPPGDLFLPSVANGSRPAPRQRPEKMVDSTRAIRWGDPSTPPPHLPPAADGQ